MGNRIGRAFVTATLGGAGVAGFPACSGALLAQNPHVPPCYPPVPAFRQAYPINGARGVSDSLPAVVFESPKALVVMQWQLQLSAPNGPPLTGGHLGPPPSPLPSPIATLAPGYVYVGASAPQLVMTTTYHVQLLDAQLLCLGPVTTGTFTTR
jgi:hypothetical protein